jgi:hypothetical protein
MRVPEGKSSLNFSFRIQATGHIIVAAGLLSSRGTAKAPVMPASMGDRAMPCPGFLTRSVSTLASAEDSSTDQVVQGGAYRGDRADPRRHVTTDRLSMNPNCRFALYRLLHHWLPSVPGGDRSSRPIVPSAYSDNRRPDSWIAVGVTITAYLLLPQQPLHGLARV